MDVLRAIFTRRSVRDYIEAPVEWDKVGYVLEAGRAAPSSGNLQNWKFIVCSGAEQRKALAEASLNQKWMEKAPIHIVVCSEPKRVEIFYGLRGERLYSVQNCAAAIENMLLAAHSLGLGSCWVGAFDEEMVKRVCSIPDYARPQAIITIGYSSGNEKDPGRTALYTVTFLGGYHGRIRDINKVMGYTSEKVRRVIASAKEAADSGSKGLDSLIEKGKTLIKKGRGNKSKENKT